MLKIGITGGIGSGKTTVARIFEVLGVPVFYADDVAKEVMHKDDVLRAELVQTFGAESFSAHGELNRPYMANLVFNDAEKLKQLNSLVHPAVFRAFDVWLEQLDGTVPYILKEAALLYESGSDKHCDAIILVLADPALRMQRVRDRDGLTAEQVQSRIDKQWTDEKKQALAQYFVYNREQEALIPQVLHLHAQFLKQAAAL